MATRRSWRRGVAAAVVAAALAGGTAAEAQTPAPVVNNPVYAAPGNYGTSWGTASYGLKRTYSEFSSPYGGGYGYGYAPASVLTGAYGTGLWRPGVPNGGYVHGAPGQYRTFPVPYQAGAWSPPMGVYAPAFGPTIPGW